MTSHLFQVVALCVGTYIVSVPIAYTCIPLVKLLGLVPVKDGELSWGTASLWPFILLIGVFLLPIEIVSRVHDRVQSYVEHKEEAMAPPPEPNPLKDPAPDPLDIPVTIDLTEFCPNCHQPLKNPPHDRHSKTPNGSKRQTT